MSCDTDVQLNQKKLNANLAASYDFVICGAGTSGSVVARRLAENPDVRVLLLEAGGTDDVSSVTDPKLWADNLHSERDWGFHAEPNPAVHGRSLPLSMGKVLGGGSSINAMLWSHGHRADWDFFALETGDQGWNYAAVSALYRRIEDWSGAPDPNYRGKGGPVHVEPASDPTHPTPVLVAAAKSIAIPTFDNPNGRMTEGEGGAATMDVIARDGTRQSIFRSYTFPWMGRPNLTVVTDALVTRLLFEGKNAIGVEFLHKGNLHQVHTRNEVVLSLGAIHTPKLLMQSGIGDEADLKPLGVEVVQHLAGVGKNFQDHLILFGCVWEYRQEGLEPNASRAVLQWKSRPELECPDIQILQSSSGNVKAAMKELGLPPKVWWSLAPGIIRPQSRGHLKLTGANADDPIKVFAGSLSHPDDLASAVSAVKLCRELAGADVLRPFIGRELLPIGSTEQEIQNFVREKAGTYWHQSCTAKMGRDPLSVVDAELKVYGIGRLRIADASVLPRVTTGNTMASCVVIGERAAEFLKAEHGL
jgi:choline dehydrogenase